MTLAYSTTYTSPRLSQVQDGGISLSPTLSREFHEFLLLVSPILGPGMARFSSFWLRRRASLAQRATLAVVARVEAAVCGAQRPGRLARGRVATAFVLTNVGRGTGGNELAPASTVSIVCGAPL